MQKQNIYQFIIISIIPLLYLIISVLGRLHRGPYWFGLNSDPEYVYLLNSLNIINLDAPAHVDHPGTPVQVFGAFIIFLAYIIQTKGNFFAFELSALNRSVLENPETYLLLLNLSVVLMICIAVLGLGLVVFLLKKDIVSAVLLQSSALFTTSLEAGNRFSPEPFLLLASYALVAILTVYLYRRNSHKSQSLSIFMAITLGTGVATKITFIPTILIAFIIFSSIRLVSSTIVISLVSLIIFTIPIFSQYSRVLSWVTSLSSRTGLYGQGEKGFIQLSSIYPNLAKLYSAEPAFIIFALTSLITLSLLYKILVERKQLDSINDDNTAAQSVDKQNIFIGKLFRLILSLSLVFVVQGLLAIKHPASGIYPSRYLVPSMAISSVLAIGVLETIALACRHLAAIGRNTRVYQMAFVGLFAFLVLSSMYSYITSNFRFYQSYRNDIANINTLISNSYSDCRVINYYRSSTKIAALNFGASLSNWKYRELLADLYSDEVLMVPGSPDKYYSLSGAEISAEKALEDTCTIFRGYSLPNSEFATRSSELDWDVVFSGDFESLYFKE